MTFTGRLSDIFGRRNVYIACLIIFMLGSYFVTIYDSALINRAIARFYHVVLNQRPPRLAVRHLYLVITGRAFQAFGAGAMVPVTIALVGDLFPPERRARPIGMIGAIDTLGWVLGHLYGGIMVRFFGKNGDWFVDAAHSIGLSISKPSWETLFILNVPISLLALVGSWWVLRRVRIPHPVEPFTFEQSAAQTRVYPTFLESIRGMRFDILGAILISLVLLAINLGLGGNTETTTSFEDLQQNATNHNVFFLIGAGIALCAFLLVESWVKHPLIRLSMFRNRNFSSASVTNLLVGFCLAIGLVSAPLLVNFRVDSPTSDKIQEAALVTGLLLSGLTIPMAMAAIPGGWLSERYGYRMPTVTGLLLACIGFVLSWQIWNEDTPYGIMALQMAMIGIGLGLTISPIGTAVLNDVHEDERGVASALVLILRLVGMTLAISSLTVFALDRVDKLVARYEKPPEGADFEEIALLSQEANFKAAIQVISELQLIGAAVSALALLFATFLRGGIVLQKPVGAASMLDLPTADIDRSPPPS
jgi:MFS family permease